MITIMWRDFSLFEPEMIERFETSKTIFLTGSHVEHVFLVITGRTELVRRLPSGEQAVLQRASAGQIIAEASVYATHYHCDCIASEETELARMPRPKFLDALRSNVELAEAWASHLAHGIQHARMLCEIRSMKTVCERLDTWIALKGPIPPKGQWQNLADELSVSREALYRELARRRSD